MSDEEKRDFKRPKGRILIFWGCGEHAPAGQPVIIDFSRIAAGQMPPGLWTSSVPMERHVSPASSKTYGSWPNSDSKVCSADRPTLAGMDGDCAGGAVAAARGGLVER